MYSPLSTVATPTVILSRVSSARRSGAEVSVRISDLVWKYSRSRGAARLVMLSLADRADDTGCSFPGIEDIRRRTGLHRATVMRELKSLQASGELAVERSPGHGNRYCITIAEPVAGCDQSQGATSREMRPHPSQLATNRSQPATRTVKEPSRNRQRAGVPRPAPTQGTTKGTSDPRVRVLLDAFAEAHQAALRQPYLMAGGRDGAALTRALRAWDAPAIEATLAAYFDDAWVREHGPTIAKWVGQLASLLSRRPRGASGGFVG
jgi:hypothetical protein